MRTWSVLVPGLAVGLISLAPVGAVAEPSSEADELRERLDELEDRGLVGAGPQDEDCLVFTLGALARTHRAHLSDGC